MTWSDATLADVATWGSGGTPQARLSAYYGGTIPWAVIGDLNDSVVRETKSLITEAGLANSSAKVVPAGTVLIAMYGSIGKLGIAGHSMATNQAIATAIPTGRVDPKFLFYYLLSQRNLLDAAGKGAAQRNISQSILKPWPIRFPSRLDEQRRIVDLLEDHLSRLDAAESYIEANIRRAANWHSGLVSRVLWHDEYQLAEVGDVLREPMRNGRSDRAASGSEAGTRTLTLTAVTKNAFTNENTKWTITTADRASGLWLEPGDVFVQRSNTPELVGTTARYDGPRDWAIFPDLLIRLRVDSRRIDSRFLTAALRSKEAHNQLRRKAKGLAGSMPKIDQAAIATAVIPVPELAEQERALLQVEQATAALDSLRSELERGRGRSAALRRSLLAAAFSGRLTGAVSDVASTDMLEEVAGV